MASTIQLKRGSGAPTSGDLAAGEPALDLTNKRLYTEDSGGSVIEIGVNPAAEITANNGIALPDNQKATFGASDDLEIYHDGSNSYIKESGAGQLIIAGSDKVQIYDPTFTTLSAQFDTNGSVKLHENGSEKLATTSSGVDVTGIVTTTAGYNFGTTTSYLYEGSANTVNLRVGTDGPYMLLGNDLGSDAAGIGNLSGDLALYANTEQVRIDSSGNVGIKTSSPARALHVNDVMRLEPRATAPSSPSAGDIFFNSTTNKLQCYDGTAWQNCF